MRVASLLRIVSGRRQRGNRPVDLSHLSDCLSTAPGALLLTASITCTAVLDLVGVSKVTLLKNVRKSQCSRG